MPTCTIPRRGFLAGTAGLLAAGAQPRASHGAEPELNVGIQLFSLRGYPVDVALRHARDLGFRFVEFYSGMYPLNSTPGQIAAMNKQLADLGLAISAHGVNGFGGDGGGNSHALGRSRPRGVRQPR